MEVHIILKCIFHIVDIILIRKEVAGTVFQHTCFMIDIHIHKVSNLGSTSANIEVSFLIEGRVLEYFVVPIHIRVNVWIQVIRRTIDFII